MSQLSKCAKCGTVRYRNQFDNPTCWSLDHRAPDRICNGKLEDHEPEPDLNPDVDHLEDENGNV